MKRQAQKRRKYSQHIYLSDNFYKSTIIISIIQLKMIKCTNGHSPQVIGHMKRCSTSLINMEMQNKTTVRYKHPLWKTVKQSLKKLKTCLPCDSKILLVIYLPKIKTCAHTKMCMKMFRRAWFIIDKNTLQRT